MAFAWLEVVRWVVALPLGLVFLLIAIGNPIAGMLAIRQGRNYSCVPLVGGVAGCAACLACPIEWVPYFAWVPLLLDYTIPAGVYTLIRLALDAHRRR